MQGLVMTMVLIITMTFLLNNYGNDYTSNYSGYRKTINSCNIVRAATDMQKDTSSNRHLEKKSQWQYVTIITRTKTKQLITISFVASHRSHVQ